MDYKVEFETIARTYIKREGIEDLLSSLSKSDFYTAPASTRYHDSYEGGLVKHSLNVFNELWNDLYLNAEFNKESIAIVSLFHDLCKVGFYKVEMRNTKNEKGKWIQVPYYTVDDKLPLGHGEKSIIMIREFMKLTTDEMLAINSHMGGWDTRPNIVNNAFGMCPLAVHLHIADLKATYLIKKEDI